MWTDAWACSAKHHIIDRGRALPSQAYSAPPIVEAHIELRFGDSIEIDAQNGVWKKLSDDYPVREEVVQKHFNIHVDVERMDSVETKLIRGSSFDSSNVIVVGPSVLQVSRIAPYGGWGDLFGRFQEAYQSAKKLWGYRKIQRIGVRYSNRIDLKVLDQRVDYEDYLNLRINLPDTFYDLSNYMLGFQFEIPDENCAATINSGIQPPAVIGHASFLLDIDVWQEMDVPQRDDVLLSKIDQMRGTKNRLFETFVTDKARDTFYVV